MLVQKLYKELLETEEKSRYLILSKVFLHVFGRKVRRNEWGFLRKLIKMYGSEVVFWSMVSSFSIDASGTPLKYVATVCRNIVKEDLETSAQPMSQEASELLDFMRNYKQPDWEQYFNDTDKAT